MVDIFSLVTIGDSTEHYSNFDSQSVVMIHSSMPFSDFLILCTLACSYCRERNNRGQSNVLVLSYVVQLHTMYAL